MNRNQSDKNTSMSFLVDRKHNTVYCVNPNGRSYIKKSTEDRSKGDRK
jgi:hypothetical protein